MEFTFASKTLFFILVCGFLYLDRVSAFQMMIHRPLVVSVIAGLLFGRITECATLGVLLEMLWISKLPVGAAVPPDDTGAAIFGSFALIVLSSLRSVGFADVAFVGALSVLIGELGKEGDLIVRRMNSKIARYGVDAVNRGDLDSISSCVHASLILWILGGLLLSTLWVSIAFATGKYAIPLMPERLISIFQIMYLVIPATGAVSVYQHCKVGKRGTVFHLALASGAFVFVIVEMGLI